VEHSHPHPSFLPGSDFPIFCPPYRNCKGGNWPWDSTWSASPLCTQRQQSRSSDWSTSDPCIPVCYNLHGDTWIQTEGSKVCYWEY
jgi:hypothetical protein